MPLLTGRPPGKLNVCTEKKMKLPYIPITKQRIDILPLYYFQHLVERCCLFCHGEDKLHIVYLYEMVPQQTDLLLFNSTTIDLEIFVL